MLPINGKVEAASSVAGDLSRYIQVTSVRIGKVISPIIFRFRIVFGFCTKIVENG